MERHSPDMPSKWPALLLFSSARRERVARHACQGSSTRVAGAEVSGASRTTKSMCTLSSDSEPPELVERSPWRLLVLRLLRPQPTSPDATDVYGREADWWLRSDRTGAWTCELLGNAACPSPTRSPVAAGSPSPRHASGTAGRPLQDCTGGRTELCTCTDQRLRTFTACVKGSRMDPSVRGARAPRLHDKKRTRLPLCAVQRYKVCALSGLLPRSRWESRTSGREPGVVQCTSSCGGGADVQAKPTHDSVHVIDFSKHMKESHVLLIATAQLASSGGPTWGGPTWDCSCKWAHHLFSSSSAIFVVLGLAIIDSSFCFLHSLSP
jgi:hypothetical protein